MAGGTASPRLVYVVDDSSFIRSFCLREFQKAGYEVMAFEDGASGIAALAARVPAILLTDLNMEGLSGFDVLEAAKKSAPNLPVVMLTGSTELGDALRSIRSGAFDYVTKPIDRGQLFDVVNRALRIAELEAENRRYVAELARRDAKMREEMELARNIQVAFLPSALPPIPGFSLGLALIPSSAIGGDIVAIYERGAGRTGILFADLTGHGVPAALLFVLFKAYADATFRSDLEPVECIRRLNRQVAANFPSGQFASASYVEIDANDGSILYVKTSQEPAIILRADGRIETLEEGGPLLGAFDPEIFGEPELPEIRIDLKPGDSLFLYTDGLVEVDDAAGTMLTLEGLKPMLREERGHSPERLVRTLHERICRYAGSDDLDDDFTALMIRKE